MAASTASEATPRSLRGAVGEFNTESRVCFNDSYFVQIRNALNLDETWLDWINYGDLKDGGGKGGDLMCRSPDQHFVLKEMNEQDHQSLLECTHRYVDHMTEGPSLLCLLLIHFRQRSRRKNYFVMTNCLSCHPSPWLGCYDLKGCQDDKTLERDGIPMKEVHKRIFKPHLWCGKCCWTEQRKNYYNGKREAFNLKISVVPEDRAKIVNALERDVKWLQENGLMDYSMLVGIKREGGGPSAGESRLKGRRNSYSSRDSVTLGLRNRKFIMADPDDPKKEKVLILYIGIIDFLQRWTAAKKVAQCIKVLERNKPTIPPFHYGARFLKHFKAALVGDGVHPIVLPSHIEVTTSNHLGLPRAKANGEPKNNNDTNGASKDITDPDDLVVPEEHLRGEGFAKVPVVKTSLPNLSTVRHVNMADVSVMV